MSILDKHAYSYLCVTCGKPVKTVTLPDSVQKYFSGFEVARNAVVYALPGTRGETVIYVTHATQKTYVFKDADTGENVVTQ